MMRKMPEERIVKEGEPIVKEGEPIGYTVQEYMLYKLDRTLAILGLIIALFWAVHKATPEAFQIANVIAAGLVGYIGGRSAGGRNN